MKKEEKISSTDLLTNNKLMTVKVNSNIHDIFSSIALEKGLNSSIAIRQLMLRYIEENSQQKDMFGLKGSTKK